MERHPGTPDSVYMDGDELYVDEKGFTRGLDEWHPPNVMEEFRTGYRCLVCKEPFGGEFNQPAWPEQCDVCGYHVRELQAREFARRNTLGEIDSPYEPPEQDTERQNWTMKDGIFVPHGWEEGGSR